jgi:hypothetical protein
VNGFVFFSVAGSVVFEIGFLKGKIYEVDVQPDE